jgi:hypothetical protein
LIPLLLPVKESAVVPSEAPDDDDEAAVVVPPIVDSVYDEKRSRESCISDQGVAAFHLKMGYVTLLCVLGLEEKS